MSMAHKHEGERDVRIVLSLWRGLIEAPIENPYELPTMRNIAWQVAVQYGLKMEDLRGPRRFRRYVIPRQEAMYLMHQTGRYGLSQIGRFFGGRDHSTVIHAINAVRRRMAAAEAEEAREAS